MPELTPFERDLRQIEADIRRLDTEYTLYFAGQLRRPPVETRNRVETMIRRYDRAYIQGYADRYRFTMLQARYHKFVELWDRGMRAREEGRVPAGLPGSGRPRAHVPSPSQPSDRAPQEAGAEPATPSGPPAGRVPAPADFHTTLVDPTRDLERLKQLHTRLAEAGAAVGQPAPAFSKFAQLVRVQMQKLQKAGASAVDFHVAVRDGKVAFSAKGLKDK
jgi:hypothetical protein